MPASATPNSVVCLVCLADREFTIHPSNELLGHLREKHGQTSLHRYIKEQFIYLSAARSACASTPNFRAACARKLALVDGNLADLLAPRSLGWLSTLIGPLPQPKPGSGPGAAPPPGALPPAAAPCPERVGPRRGRASPGDAPPG